MILILTPLVHFNIDDHINVAEVFQVNAHTVIGIRNALRLKIIVLVIL